MRPPKRDHRQHECVRPRGRLSARKTNKRQQTETETERTEHFRHNSMSDRRLTSPSANGHRIRYGANALDLRRSRDGTPLDAWSIACPRALQSCQTVPVIHPVSRCHICTTTTPRSRLHYPSSSALDAGAAITIVSRSIRRAAARVANA